MSLMTSSTIAQNLCPNNNHPHAIDIGVGVKFACCNVGAKVPWEYGELYAWGETSTKTIYSKDTYSHYDKRMFKYEDLGQNIAGTIYDVAHVKWGGKWVMPSENQISLLKKCKLKWEEINGVNGIKVTGPNGKSIFLPAAGYYMNNRINEIGKDHLYYWTSTQCYEKKYCAWSLIFLFGDIPTYESDKYIGRSVRPIMR